MADGFANDPQSEQVSACPGNFFGITDYRKLASIEKLYTLKRQFQLQYSRKMGAFDMEHLQSIHQFIFQDVFPWEGQFRVVNISKGTNQFAWAPYIASALVEALAKLQHEGLLQGLTPATFAQRAGFSLSEINAIHPFREGNGRTQREFIRQLALQAGHLLAWERTSPESMIAASIRSHTTGDHSGLTILIHDAIIPPGTLKVQP